MRNVPGEIITFDVGIAAAAEVVFIIIKKT